MFAGGEVFLAGFSPGSKVWRGKPGGTDDRFSSSVERLAWRGPDRPRKTMVCPTAVRLNFCLPG